MDIITLMLAKAMTPQGQTDAYVSKANKAAAKAAKAEEDAAAAIALVNEAAEGIEEKVQAAEDMLEAAQNTMETLQAEQLDIEDVDAEIKKFDLSYSQITNNSDEYYTNLHMQYPDGSGGVIPGIVALKKATGQSEIAGMTQKAITDALNLKADAATTATKEYVDEAIAASPNNPANVEARMNLGADNNGKLVVVGADGNIISGTVLESELIDALVMSGGYTARNAVGLEIDYENKTFTRTQQAVGKSAGNDFNSFLMYGGRKRCLVADDGSIYAFEGDPNFSKTQEYQTMIYQPKFYYQRIPLNTTNGRVGKIINRDSIMISSVPQNGFKIHPLFVDANGEELDYVLLGAYEGGVYSALIDGNMATTYNYLNAAEDKMISTPNTKPITGSCGLNLEKAEQIAANRGTGWHIMNMQAESANQMLEIIEFGTLNGQSVLGKGISNMPSSGNTAQPALTGSTYSLDSTSGAATSTTYNDSNNENFTETEEGKVAVSYRGFENPWGNIWTLLGGIIINGNGTQFGGVPYICQDFNYSYSALGNNYESAGFSLPNNSGWISALGYGNKKYDWLLMPAAADSSANSALPIGDNGWFDSNLSGNRMVVHGGSWSFGESNGPFYYACDKQLGPSAYQSYGSRLMFIPTKNNIYTANIAKWQQKMNIGG